MLSLRSVTHGLVAAALLGQAGMALASGYALRQQSALGQGASYAGAPARGDDPSVMFFNPAAMGWLPGIQATLVGSAIMPRAQIETAHARHAPALGGRSITGSISGDAASDAIVPAAYATMAIGRHWHLGLAITSPFGQVTKYDQNFIGRYHAQTTELRTINIAPSIAWRPHPTVSLGAGLQIQRVEARITNVVDFGATLAAGGARVAPGSLDGRSSLSGDDLAFGWKLGAQWRPQPGTALGIAFRSAIHHEVAGESRFQGAPAALATTFRDGGGRVKLTTPESVSIGLTQAIGSAFTLLAGAEWTNWSRFRTLTATFDTGLPPSIVEQHWHDTVYLSLGGEYRVHDALTLRSGIGWDQSPVRERTRSPRTPDSNRLWLSAGFTWNVMPNVALSAGYTHILGNTVDIALTSGGPTSTNFIRGDLVARYSTSVNIVTAQLRVAF